MRAVQLWHAENRIRGKVEVFRLLQEVTREQGGSMLCEFVITNLKH